MAHLGHGWIEVGDERAERGYRVCEHPGCTDEGRYRAPRSRHQLHSYYWFCLEHVRGYNAQWDFFAGMSSSEIDAFRHADMTWHRPTWPMGPHMPFARLWNAAQWGDLFELFGEAADDAYASPQNHRVVPPVNATEREALAVMGLGCPATLGEIKARFKMLVKRLHPDTNGGDKGAEDRLKSVIEAYRVLLRERGA